MTDPSGNAGSPVASFYDGLAPDYDAMTCLEERLKTERSSYAALVERYGIRRALDAGSGTGFHSLMLAALGVEVTAVDCSAGMLERLDERARTLGLPVRTLQSDFASLPGRVAPNLDAVLCMGNTFPHLLEPGARGEALAAFRALLRPGGLLVVQSVNFHRVISLGQNIQSVRASGTTTYVRWYEFTPGPVRFHVLTIWREGDVLKHADRSVPLLPADAPRVCAELEEAGFGAIRVFGSVLWDDYDPLRSPDLVVTALRRHESPAESAGRKSR
ncbi:MAG: class I SAM-dependent methyltransferase [Bacteroidota bacterium]